MRTFIKGHAARIGLDLSHLSSPKPKPSSPSALSQLRYAPEHLRRAAPTIAMTWFMIHGCAPLLPVEPEPYDLIVATPEGLQRVQVKSTTHKNQAGTGWSRSATVQAANVIPKE